ncbi:MAG: hypothetical protein KAU07_01985 [Candidatus Andersenbacteria bacterium]|nr:hypothetical protein [Candidatus Andersenbacteria bacterium]
MKTHIERISNGLYILLFGFVFLWVSLGFVKINVIFQFLRLWPLFFIVVGIEIIFKRTKLSFFKLLSPIIVISSVIGIMYVSQAGDLFHQRQVEIFKINQNFSSDEKIADFNVNFSSGLLLVTDSRNNSISGDLSVPKGIVPELNFKEFEKEDLYEIYGNPLSDYVFSPWDNNHKWDIRIGSNIPSKMKIKTYASKNKFNISNLSVSDFILDTKISSNEIILNDTIEKLRINSVGSKLSILIPKEIGVKISLNKFLITDNFNELGLDRGFKEYVSPNYEDVTKRIDMDLDLKFSELEIKYY